MNNSTYFSLQIFFAFYNMKKYFYLHEKYLISKMWVMQ